MQMHRYVKTSRYDVYLTLFKKQKTSQKIVVATKFAPLRKEVSVIAAESSIILVQKLKWVFR